MSGLLPIADVVAKNREHLLGQQLQLEQQQFERLKHDFSYNLSLLRERDTELERYDMEAAALRGQLDQRDAALQEAQRAIEELETQAATAASKASAISGWVTRSPASAMRPGSSAVATRRMASGVTSRMACRMCPTEL